MSCGTDISNFERKKKQMIDANIWKSNFISLWEQYGTFQIVEGVKCFDYYRIDGPGEGQEKMSKLLKHPTLHTDVQDSDLDWVRLVFQFFWFLDVDEAAVSQWISDTQTKLLDYDIDHLSYTIVNNKVTDHVFSYQGVVVESAFLDELSFLIAEYHNLSASDVLYDEDITVNDVSLMIPSIANYTSVGGVLTFDIHLMHDVVAGYMLEHGIGTDILDQLVVDGVLFGVGDMYTSTMNYALPVDSVRGMNGLDFIKIIQSALKFDYKEDSNWYDVLLDVAKLIVAFVAALFGYYQLAISLVISFAADVTQSKALKIIAAVYGLSTGGVDSLYDIGVSEAMDLLMNVYSLYVSLAFKPDKVTEDVDSDTYSDLFYRAPYSAYSDLYCYKPLVTVSIDNKY